MPPISNQRMLPFITLCHLLFHSACIRFSFFVLQRREGARPNFCSFFSISFDWPTFVKILEPYRTKDHQIPSQCISFNVQRFSSAMRHAGNALRHSSTLPNSLKKCGAAGNTECIRLFGGKSRSLAAKIRQFTASMQQQEKLLLP
ncbi:MAG: hypothetical protein OWS74_09210, partial [Firmicutes bacterium]|nr:hypothetical protein [Bacillota bacterium]